MSSFEAFSVVALIFPLFPFELLSLLKLLICLSMGPDLAEATIESTVFLFIIVISLYHLKKSVVERGLFANS